MIIQYRSQISKCCGVTEGGAKAPPVGGCARRVGARCLGQHLQSLYKTLNPSLAWPAFI